MPAPDLNEVESMLLNATQVRAVNGSGPECVLCGGESRVHATDSKITPAVFLCAGCALAAFTSYVRDVHARLG